MDMNASAAIQAVRFDGARLVVRFEGGEEYLFVGVPVEVGRAFSEAGSKAAFFDEQIRGRYPYNKLA